jgi:hypothetical protein
VSPKCGQLINPNSPNGNGKIQKKEKKRKEVEAMM